MAEGSGAPSRALTGMVLAVVALVVTGCGDDSDESTDDPHAEAEEGGTTGTDTTDAGAEDTEDTEDTEDGEVGEDREGTVVSVDDLVDEYRDCMADEGADLDADGAPTIQMLVDATDMPPEAVGELQIPDPYLDAHAACGERLETALDAGATLPTTSDEAPADPELARQMHAAVECLNDRGWDFLEPGVETGPLVMAPRDPDFDWDTPGALDDQFECQQEAGMIPSGEFTPAPPPGG